jgi:hypothetical protein
MEEDLLQLQQFLRAYVSRGFTTGDALLAIKRFLEKYHMDFESLCYHIWQVTGVNFNLDITNK